MSREAYERQNGVCAKCGQYFEFEQMEADHITRGVRTVKRMQRIVGCFVANVTVEKVVFECLAQSHSV